MKELSLKAKILTSLIILISMAAAIEAIVENYQIEKSLKELKAQIAIEAAAPVVEVKALEVKKIEEAKPEPMQKKETEIAPVQFIAHEEIPLVSEIQEHIEHECERLEVDAAYIYALIESESSFRTGLLVEDGGGQSAGLCQINSVNWPDMEERGLDPMNELDNITYCVILVRSYLDKYPTINHVTTCYKAGEGGAKRLNYQLAVCDQINDRTEYYQTILKGVNNGND